MKKKLLSLISTVLCLCVVLSACGGPANSDPSSSASESQSGDNTQDKTLTIATMTETTTLSPLYTLLTFGSGPLFPFDSRNMGSDHSTSSSSQPPFL